jgi:hypothetical protein
MTPSTSPTADIARQSAFAQWLELLRSSLFQALTVRADRLG